MLLKGFLLNSSQKSPVSKILSMHTSLHLNLYLQLVLQRKYFIQVSFLVLFFVHIVLVKMEHIVGASLSGDVWYIANVHT